MMIPKATSIPLSLAENVPLSTNGLNGKTSRDPHQSRDPPVWGPGDPRSGNPHDIGTPWCGAPWSWDPKSGSLRPLRTTMTSKPYDLLRQDRSKMRPALPYGRVKNQNLMIKLCKF